MPSHWRTSSKARASGSFTTFFGANDSSNVAHARRERAFLHFCHRGGGDVIKIFSRQPPTEAIIKLKKIIVRHLHGCAPQTRIYGAACGVIFRSFLARCENFAGLKNVDQFIFETRRSRCSLPHFGRKLSLGFM
jgi:hypothetical protein